MDVKFFISLLTTHFSLLRGRVKCENAVKSTIDLNKLWKQCAVCVGSICTSHNEILKLSLEHVRACVFAETKDDNLICLLIGIV